MRLDCFVAALTMRDAFLFNTRLVLSLATSRVAAPVCTALLRVVIWLFHFESVCAVPVTHRITDVHWVALKVRAPLSVDFNVHLEDEVSAVRTNAAIVSHVV